MKDNKFITELKKDFKIRLNKYGASESKENELKTRLIRIVRVLKLHNRFEDLDSDSKDDWSIRCQPNGYKETTCMRLDCILDYIFDLEYTWEDFLKSLLSLEEVKISGSFECFAIHVNGKGYVQSERFYTIFKKYQEEYWSNITKKEFVKELESD